jgi:D-alanine transaminase
VIRLYGGRPFTIAEHLARLAKSAAEIWLEVPLRAEALRGEIERLVAQSGVREGMVYLQLTRGVAPRSHVIPAAPGSTLLFYARPLPVLPPVERAPAAKLMTVEDERWRRCWIKSIALLPNILAKTAAVAAGADEAVFVEDGVVSECSASNVFAVIDGTLVTCPVGPKVLPGITRAVLIELAARLKIPVAERAMALDEAKAAGEIFITSTTREISPVDVWDGARVGGGREVTTRLHRALKERVASETR